MHSLSQLLQPQKSWRAHLDATDNWRIKGFPTFQLPKLFISSPSFPWLTPLVLVGSRSPLLLPLPWLNTIFIVKYGFICWQLGLCPNCMAGQQQHKTLLLVVLLLLFQVLFMLLLSFMVLMLEYEHERLDWLVGGQLVQWLACGPGVVYHHHYHRLAFIGLYLVLVVVVFVV